MIKRQIRFGAFETNSSSTHSLIVCTQQQYLDWKDGKLLWNKYAPLNNSLVPVDEAVGTAYTYSEFVDCYIDNEDNYECLFYEYTNNDTNLVIIEIYGDE